MTPTELTTKLHAFATRLHVKDITLLAGRLLLSLLFLHEGVTLATHFDAAAKAMAAQGVGLPLFIATIALQLGAGLSIGLGLLTRLGAVGLGLFCLATATLFHTNFASQNELLHFEKDLAIAGGMFVLAIAGAGRVSLDGVVAGYVKQRQRESTVVETLMAENQMSVGELKLPV
ncbi:DoxX family protein [Mesorhizobium sp. PAMC28654]|uniref:DoxX family protein n=1 Tax=Mesorhizobium sp. PAMC28654 TaxID=2880934 RepID=UPI001D0ADC28|nr:DoxX family protein [Mesorhizobium sp. PAMC28654]UDL89350.1 DoxX family protein [Mesorhizobium sp. PAMC28654]